MQWHTKSGSVMEGQLLVLIILSFQNKTRFSKPGQLAARWSHVACHSILSGPRTVFFCFLVIFGHVFEMTEKNLVISLRTSENRGL